MTDPYHYNLGTTPYDEYDYEEQKQLVEDKNKNQTHKNHLLVELWGNAEGMETNGDGHGSYFIRALCKIFNIRKKYMAKTKIQFNID